MNDYYYRIDLCDSSINYTKRYITNGIGKRYRHVLYVVMLADLLIR